MDKALNNHTPPPKSNHLGLGLGDAPSTSPQDDLTLTTNPAYRSSIPSQSLPPDAADGTDLPVRSKFPKVGGDDHDTHPYREVPTQRGRGPSDLLTGDPQSQSSSSRSDITPGSPTGTFSTFSMTSTMESRVFREDGGRRFQAQNDEYSLPNDEQELERLECQHRAFKAVQKGINYLAPVHGNLHEGARALDVGCGTGIWTIEMAKEFPNVEWIATDLTPIQRDDDLPDNLHFVQNDITQGLPFPDQSFDLVHARLLIMGIRNWQFIIEEVLRVLKPGGMIYHVECDFPWGLPDVPENQWRERAPGHIKFQDYLKMAVETRGYEAEASKTIPRLMANSGQIRDDTQISSCLPLWAWSSDPHMRQSGEIMRVDAEDIPNSVQIVIMDTCEVPAVRYEELKRGYLRDLGREGATTAVPISHNFGWKT